MSEPTVTLPIAFLDDMASAGSKGELLRVMAVWIGRIVNADRCSIMLVDQAPQTQSTALHGVIYALNGRNEVPEGHAIPLANSNPGVVMQTREPLCLDDLAKCSDPISQKLVEAGLHASVMVPLLNAGVCHGTLNVAKAEINAFNSSDVERLRALAQWIAGYLSLAQQLEALTTLAHTDHLTGALNRLAFEEASNRLFAQWRRKQITLALILFDLDMFKTINDEFGHQAGDDVLVRTSRLVRERKRGTDIFARLGGEEFAVLCPGTNESDASALAERYRLGISELDIASIVGKERKITVSVGVGCPTRSDESFEVFFARVDKLLYEAKRTGRNRVVAAQVSEWQPVGV